MTKRGPFDSVQDGRAADSKLASRSKTRTKNSRQRRPQPDVITCALDGSVSTMPSIDCRDLGILRLLRR